MGGAHGTPRRGGALLARSSRMGEQKVATDGTMQHGDFDGSYVYYIGVSKEDVSRTKAPVSQHTMSSGIDGKAASETRTQDAKESQRKDKAETRRHRCK